MSLTVTKYVAWDEREDRRAGESRDRIEEAEVDVAALQSQISWFGRFLDWLDGLSSRYRVHETTELIWLRSEYIDD